MKTWMKKRYVIIPAVILAVLLLGKTFFPYLVWLPAMNVTQTLFGWWPASWKEEVLLHDGSRIIVKRSQTRGGRHEIGQDVPVNKHTISFVLPDSRQRITWQTTIGNKIEDTELQPLALEIVSGIPYLVTTPMGYIAYNKWKRPNPPYVLLKYTESEWQQIPLAELPSQVMRANMVINAFQLRSERLLSHRFDVVPAKEVSEINSQNNEKEVHYLQDFVREPYVGGEKYSELIHTADNSWLGIDWFVDQPNYRSCLNVCTQKRVNPQECPCDRFFKGDK